MPGKQVTGKLSGSALMRDLDHAVTLIEAVVKAATVPVTLKMRLGWDDATRNAPELARRAEAAGVALITVHGRTRCQHFKGTADWAFVRNVARGGAHSRGGQRRHPRSRRRARRACRLRRKRRHGRPRRLRCALAAVAHRHRARLGPRPGPPPLDRQRDIALGHVEAMIEQDGASVGLRTARKHIGWYLASSGRPAATVKAWRRRLCTSEDAREVRAGLARFYDEALEAAA